MSEIDIEGLAEDLEEFDTPDTPKGRSPREERIIAGFEEIQRFVEEQGRAPQHGEDRDIFERLYAVRLDRLRELGECRALLLPLDHQGLLGDAPAAATEEPFDPDALAADLAELDPDTIDITELKHVRSADEKRAAEEIANREPCQDFARFKPLFDSVQDELDRGVRVTRPFERKAEIEPGRFFIVGGQKAYVASRGEDFLTAQGMVDARLRVIFDNGTESNMLMRSLQRALHKDDAGRRITDPSAGPLFGDAAEEGDTQSGTVYVLRSKSDDPMVAQRRDVLHKIGVTGGSVERRIANAAQDPTFLLAPVEVVTTYKLVNINRARLEFLIHKVFGSARLEIEIKDRFGHPVSPREWFLVPLFVIDEAIEKIRDGTITSYRYDPERAELVSVASAE